MTYPIEAIGAQSGKVAMGVVEFLNTASLPVPVSFERVYMPRIKLRSSGETKYVVAVVGRGINRLTRAGLKHSVVLEIGILRKFGDHEDLQEADPLIHLCESVSDSLANGRIQISDSLVALAVDDGDRPAIVHDPIYDPEMWDMNRQFAGIIRATLRVLSI